MSDYPNTNERQAYDTLRTAILKGELPSGRFLSQRDLAERAGVAVSTVRAALRSLESDGFIENVPHWGVRIPSETAETLKDRYYVREVLEVAAVQRLVEQANPIHATTLRDLAQKCDMLAVEDPDNSELYAQRHFAYHHYIAECSGSQVLVEMLDRSFLRTMMLFNAKRGWARGYDRRQHVAFTEDILSGDLERAIAAMRYHVRRGITHELEAIGAVSPENTLS
jgi:DNA-binding GntR family transcriptional regulator